MLVNIIITNVSVDIIVIALVILIIVYITAFNTSGDKNVTVVSLFFCAQYSSRFFLSFFPPCFFYHPLFHRVRHGHCVSVEVVTRREKEEGKGCGEGGGGRARGGRR